MPHTKAEKERLTEVLNKYIQAGNNMTVLRYARLMAWLSGETFAEIGNKAGVSAQAVAHSVKRDLEEIERFAKENYKDYASNKRKGTTS